MSSPKLIHLSADGNPEFTDAALSEFVTVSRQYIQQLEAREKELMRELDEERRVSQQLGRRLQPKGD